MIKLTQKVIIPYSDADMCSDFVISSSGSPYHWQDTEYVPVEAWSDDRIQKMLDEVEIEFGVYDGSWLETFFAQQLVYFFGKNPCDWKLTVINPEPDRIRCLFVRQFSDGELQKRVEEFAHGRLGKEYSDSVKYEIEEKLRYFEDAEWFEVDFRGYTPKSHFSLEVEERDGDEVGDTYKISLYSIIGTHEPCAHITKISDTKTFEAYLEWADEKKEEVLARIIQEF